MLVACDDVETAKWTVAMALREAKPVLFYRSFTTAQQSSGRYWFVRESPFQKIDISFDPMEEYMDMMQRKEKLGHEITVCEVYRRPSSMAMTSDFVQISPLIIGQQEQEIGSYIYRSLCSLRRCFRGGDDTRGFEDLQTAASELSWDSTMAGGRIEELAHTVAGIVEHIRSGKQQ